MLLSLWGFFQFGGQDVWVSEQLQNLLPKNSRLGVKLGPLLFLAAFTHKGHESVPYNNVKNSFGMKLWGKNWLASLEDPSA